ncbi:glucosylglycerol hydrolase [Haloarchaeobius sp. TZWSO28]|uniref:glucosylglycerol hydrolase n=1 Tax=Haloarchaeobius sp. TZWSO28 TaxID=3446119 RepID=UPI003EB96748
MTETDTPRLLEEPTEDRCAWTREIQSEYDDEFRAAQRITERLGAHLVEGCAEVGFWTPELLDREIPADAVHLEVLTATEPVDLSAEETDASFERTLVETRREGEFTWAVVEGMRAGTRDVLGSLYRLSYETEEGRETIVDPVAYSVPFGSYGPAEFYDMEQLDEERADREYFEDLAEKEYATTEDEWNDDVPRFEPSTSMLEIHPGTATEAGSLGGLARKYAEIGEKQRQGEDMTPAERNFVGYDAVQVMPIEPITEHGERDPHFELGVDASENTEGEVEVTLRRPDMINWGYDIVISAFSATNPAILESRRPDELVDFIATLHNLPEPMTVTFDLALGHADNGGLDLLNDYFFAGPGMYGQHLDYTQPVVRALLLEMQRRKMEFGADGIRVDGAQDFTVWDPEAEEEYHDDEFLAEMDRLTYEVAGQEYRPWMIFEDGRPWPRPDWELASTYRTLIEQHPHSFQWSPVTFAHNTPALLTFWATKWWRVFEVADFGSQWITGVANHDTVRRGTQRRVDDSWDSDAENPYLGDSLPEAIDRAYDNPASGMLFHAFLPGVPMDFLNANMRGPWGFIRDTDETWDVKVVAEEANFLDWQVPEGVYEDSEYFPRLKALGFETKDELKDFVDSLERFVDATDYDLELIGTLFDEMGVPLEDTSPEGLHEFADSWMKDVQEYANLSNWHAKQGDERTAFDREVREFRQDRPWLRTDIDVHGDETFDYIHPTEGTVCYFGYRRAPDESEELLFVANMEGTPVTVTPADLADECPEDGWELALAAPGVDEDAVAAAGETTLDDSEAVLFRRVP